ncbi:unnamed protein product [Gordionus sp. m RMFG-2023]
MQGLGGKQSPNGSNVIYYQNSVMNRADLTTKIKSFNCSPNAKEFFPTTKTVPLSADDLKKKLLPYLDELRYDPGMLDKRCLAICTFLSCQNLGSELLNNTVKIIIAHCEDSNFRYSGVRLLNFLIHNLSLTQSEMFSNAIFDLVEAKYKEISNMNVATQSDRIINFAFLLADLFCQIDLRNYSTPYRDVSPMEETKFSGFYIALLDICGLLLTSPCLLDNVRCLFKISGYELECFEKRKNKLKLLTNSSQTHYFSSPLDGLFNTIKDRLLSNELDRNLKEYLLHIYLLKNRKWDIMENFLEIKNPSCLNPTGKTADTDYNVYDANNDNTSYISKPKNMTREDKELSDLAQGRVLDEREIIMEDEAIFLREQNLDVLSEEESGEENDRKFDDNRYHRGNREHQRGSHDNSEMGNDSHDSEIENDSLNIRPSSINGDRYNSKTNMTFDYRRKGDDEGEDEFYTPDRLSTKYTTPTGMFNPSESENLIPLHTLNSEENKDYDRFQADIKNTRPDGDK